MHLYKALSIFFFINFSPAHNQLALSKMPEAVARSMKATSVGDFMEAAAPLGAKYLFFFSSHSLKTRKNCISFSWLVLLILYIF